MSKQDSGAKEFSLVVQNNTLIQYALSFDHLLYYD